MPPQPSIDPDNRVIRKGRGPTHRHPVLLRFASMLWLLTRMLLVIVLVGLPIAVVAFETDPRKLLVLPAMLIIVAALSLSTACRVGCRVCGMRMLLSKHCSKSPKAPDWPLLGPHGTMAVLALFKDSVRCPYCGTPNSLIPRDRDDD